MSWVSFHQRFLRQLFHRSRESGQVRVHCLCCEAFCYAYQIFYYLMISSNVTLTFRTTAPTRLALRASSAPDASYLVRATLLPRPIRPLDAFRHAITPGSHHPTTGTCPPPTGSPPPRTDSHPPVTGSFPLPHGSHTLLSGSHPPLTNSRPPFTTSMTVAGRQRYRNNKLPGSNWKTENW